MRREIHRRMVRQVGLLVVVALSAAVIVVFFHANRGATATLRPDFEDRLVTSVFSPIDLAFAPDGRMLIATQPGLLRVYKDGELLQAPALDLSGKICSNSERGLLGVALDPSFSTHRYVYLYYTFNKFGECPVYDTLNPNNPVNRVSRFVMSGDTIDPSSEKVLIDNIPSPSRHNSGDLSFGKNGYLYVSVGDGGCDYAGDSGCQINNDASRDPHVLLGKILRITRNGSIPPANPYQGTDSARCNLTGRTDVGKKCQETFASGLRNPFRFAFDPDVSGTRFFIGDVGNEAWDEIDQGKKGADYAWNLCEGTHDNGARAGSVDCSAAPYTPPVHEYSHDTGCSSITGGAFVPNGVWPASYDDSYLYGDYVCNKILELAPKEGGGFTKTEFASGLGEGGPIAMAFGPYGSSQALYYTTYANGGEVHRITEAGANRAPHAVLSVNPDYGDVPLTVNFDGSGSTDPDSGDSPTAYRWDFGDDSPAVETTTPNVTHTYAQAGTHTATLTVRDTNGAEDTARVRIYAGNVPPEPTISSPAQDKLFAVGEKIVLRGSATDPEDGELPDSALSWEVVQHHNGDHTHPYFAGTGTDLTFTAADAEDLLSTDPEENYLEIRLTATDSKGLSGTVTQTLTPKTVDVTFESQPSGLKLRLNGTTFTTPRTFVSWEGYKLRVAALSPQALAGSTHTFDAWSDGEAWDHDIVTGAQPSAYTATYKACTITGTSGNNVLEGTSGADTICGMGGNDTIKGMAGNDTIDGMGGEDAPLRGDGGADMVTGGSGDDNLYGGNGNDALSSRDGVSGNDSLDGGSGTDTKTTDATEKTVVGFP